MDEVIDNIINATSILLLTASSTISGIVVALAEIPSQHPVP